ncbi:protein FAM83G isoform X2 [Salarias fasciatus]|uniref:protein FAM83G isoform X2 n=1 Tax=Salarias fasciatus TaxID=181472 RepID=UPI0011765190|nr:protein FAM83G-like isoform X2 [Salarias fasciatus]
MALSQIQCLDDNNVNPRTHESKPEFFYCEDQRLALETLLRDGRETFFKYLEARGVRGFLSDLELEALSAAMEPYDPGKDLFPENVEGEPTPLSQHYWPDLSDTSIPEMDLGWPDSEGYRGVTRTTVYTQPPLDGQAHIKEVVRKMIAQAQRVIGVVMDIFTDVDIFRDLIDIGFKKRVSVYILLERTNLPHFLSMCRRANMHSGHLKHLRVRCTEGAEFHTRSCTKVRGRMGHRFMFVDGDKAVSGSYSFTWMSSRLDRNLITVTTGQAVEGFDRLFRYLYANSSSVDLRQVVMEPEPEPEVLPQPVTVVLPSAAVARKMYNPKYALVAASNPSPTTSVGHESPKEPETPENPKKKRRVKASEEDALPLHPGLVNLEKAYLIPYLPTWPEPDPPSDVIGFINIRDANKPAQVHLQRSEMFETSQAIRFSSPFSKPAEALPEVCKPRQLTVTAEEMNKPQPALNERITAALEINKTKAKEFTADKVLPAHVSENYPKSKEKAPEQILPASVPKFQDLGKDTIKALNTDNKLYGTNTAANRVSGSETPYMSLRSGSKTPIPSKGTSSQLAETLSRNSLKSNSLRRSDATKEADAVSSLNTEGVAVYRPHTLESNSTQTPQLPASSSSNSITKVETTQNTVASLTDSHTQAARMKPESVSISSAAVNSPSVPQNNPTSITTMHSNTTAGASVLNNRASVPLGTQFSAAQNPSRSSSTSSSLTSPLPVPKPQTVQLLAGDDSSDSQACLVKKPETSSEPQVIHNEPPVQTAVPSSPLKGPDGKAGTQTHSEHSRTTKETAHPRESLTSKETKIKEADGRLDGKRAQQHDVASPSSRPPRPPRPPSGNQLVARPWVNRPLNQTESKVLEVLEFRKVPTRPPPPAAAAAAAVPAGQKQVSQNQQQGGASRQPPAAQGRTRAGPTQSQTSHQKPQSFLHTQANLQSQPLPHTQSQVASAADAPGQDEGKGPFGFSFSKLYNLRGMRTNKAPAQAKSGGSRSPAEPRKSTS